MQNTNKQYIELVIVVSHHVLCTRSCVTKINMPKPTYLLIIEDDDDNNNYYNLLLNKIARTTVINFRQHFEMDNPTKDYTFKMLYLVHIGELGAFEMLCPIKRHLFNRNTETQTHFRGHNIRQEGRQHGIFLI